MKTCGRSNQEKQSLFENKLKKKTFGKGEVKGRVSRTGGPEHIKRRGKDVVGFRSNKDSSKRRSQGVSLKRMVHGCFGGNRAQKSKERTTRHMKCQGRVPAGLTVWWSGKRGNRSDEKKVTASQGAGESGGEKEGLVGENGAEGKNPSKNGKVRQEVIEETKAQNIAQITKVNGDKKKKKC